MLTLNRIQYGTEREQRKAYQKFTHYTDIYRKLTGEEFRVKTD